MRWSAFILRHLIEVLDTDNAAKTKMSKIPCALQMSARDKSRAVCHLGKFGHHQYVLCSASTLAGISTVALEPCPGAEGTSRVPWEHLSLSSCALTLWKSYCIFFPPPGNGYIEGKELENFFQELERARKGAGVVRASPGFAPSFPCSLVPKESHSCQPHLLWALMSGAGAPLGGKQENTSTGNGEKAPIPSLLAGRTQRRTIWVTR